MKELDSFFFCWYLYINSTKQPLSLPNLKFCTSIVFNGIIDHKILMLHYSILLC
ncbi:hypothetical protein HanRHA438_Chr09g0409191 [Helianthus annuus]|nr:hypothetical protein HanRHA438_Chr09g0409191 [Helianthus annuus]